jgi:hypothetical protein
MNLYLRSAGKLDDKDRFQQDMYSAKTLSHAVLNWEGESRPQVGLVLSRHHYQCESASPNSGQRLSEPQQAKRCSRRVLT